MNEAAGRVASKRSNARPTCFELRCVAVAEAVVEEVEAQGKARARVKAAVRRLEVVAAVLAVLAATARPQSAVHAGLVRTLIHPSLSLARGMVEVTLSQT